MAQDGLKEELLEMFHRSVHLLHRSGPHFRRHGGKPPLPPAQSRLLRLLAALGPAGQRDLAARLDIRSASLSELLAKLEKAAWIRRRPNENDKRAIDVELTEEGENMLQNMGNEHVEMAEEVFGALSEEELRQLHGLLGKLIGDWETRFENDDRRFRPGGPGRGEGRPGQFRHLRGRPPHDHHGPHDDHDHHRHGPHDHHDHHGPHDHHEHPAHPGGHHHGPGGHSEVRDDGGEGRGFGCRGGRRGPGRPDRDRAPGFERAADQPGSPANTQRGDAEPES